MTLDLLVINPVYVENLGMFLREAQLSGANRVYVQDKFNLLDKENKQRLINWSGRVSYHNPPVIVNDAKSFLKQNTKGYRRIATVVNPDSQKLTDFKYSVNDLLIFGDERNGLDKELVSLCDEQVYIPQFQPVEENRRIQCRTLVSAQAMFLYEYMRQN